MNFTNDGQPLGEHIDTFEAIQRGAVNGILSAADEVLATKQLAERQTAALNKIREIHKPVDDGYGLKVCDHDRFIPGIAAIYPCATILAIDEAGV